MLGGGPGLPRADEVAVRDVDVDQAEELVMAVAGGRLTEVPDIARELRKLYL